MCFPSLIKVARHMDKIFYRIVVARYNNFCNFVVAFRFKQFSNFLIVLMDSFEAIKRLVNLIHMNPTTSKIQKISFLCNFVQKL